jgi:two-component system phosphate regulon sensor histidine kinase PhoR
MKLGLRWKLFLYAVGVSLAVLIPGSLYLQRELRSTLTERIERELETDLRAARVAFETSSARSPAELDMLAGQLGEAFDLRVTLIAADGRVLGDSEVAQGALDRVENHGDRPEVVDARSGRLGSHRRRSSTVDVDLLYMAEHLRDGIVVRIAKPLVEIDDALARLRWLLVIAGAITLAAAVALSAGASHLLSRTMRDLVESARAIAEAGGQPGQVAGSVQRMSQEIERTVGALATERARFAAVLEGMSDGVVAIDHEGCVTLMNRAAQALLGAGAEVLGRSFLEVVRVPALDELVAGDQEHGSAEIDLPNTRRRVLAVRAPQPGGGIVLVMHDVTAVHRLETIRRDFVANVSHELRTPVSVIRANAETLASGALDDDTTAPVLVAAINRNAERLTDLIEDLLDLSRLEAGQHKMEIEAVPLSGAAQRALEAVDRIARKRGTEIAIDVPADLSASADAGALHQVLVNVITNAIVHTPEKSRVSVSARPNGSRMRIEVRDDGHGIPPAHRERIFERFYRVDPGRSRGLGGTGLGLSIVKHMVEAMGGRVGVSENEPRGAAFWIDLPPANS